MSTPHSAASLLRNPVRLFLVVLLLATSLTFAAVMVAINGSIASRVAQVRARVGNTILKGSITFTGFNGNAFSPSPLISGITPGASGQTLLGGGTVSIVPGRNLRTSDSGRDVALMGQALAQANNLNVGSHVTLQGKSVTVVGLYATGQRFGDNSITMPVGTVEHLYKLNGVTTLTVYARSSADVPAVTSRLQKALGSKVDIVNGTTASSAVFSTLQATQSNIRSALVASMLAAALVVIFAVFLVVRERTREIGILKALGASNARVVGQFAVEVFSMSALSAVVAVVLLAVAGPSIAHQFDITPSAFAGTAGRGFGFGGGGFRRAVPGPGGTQQLTAGLTLDTLLVVLALGIALARWTRAEELLRRVGLEPRRHGDRVNRLSAGQQQRVAIARSLANRPAIVLADEPTGNLDRKNSQHIVDLLRDLANRGAATVILVTHDPAIAGRANRRLEMQDGKLL